jgi:hypothetical protein
VVAAFFEPSETALTAPQIVRELLKIYVVVWVSFVIVLTAGTISSELGVVADAVLSRGISRWQYYWGKWTARLTAVLGVYLLVMVPTLLILRVNAPVRPADPLVVPLELAYGETGDPPRSLALSEEITWIGSLLALGHVAALLTFVVTCGVAFSASFDSTVISIPVGWVSIYGTGLILSMLDVAPLSPWRLISGLPDILVGKYVLTDEAWLFGGWLGGTLVVNIFTGSYFSARDL